MVGVLIILFVCIWFIIICSSPVKLKVKCKQRLLWSLSPPVILSSPPRAEILKSACPSAALSWPPVRLYQRSLAARSTSKPTEQEQGDDQVSSHYTPLLKRRRTTTQGDAHATQSTVLDILYFRTAVLYVLLRRGRCFSGIFCLTLIIRGQGQQRYKVIGDADMMKKSYF